LAEEGVRTGGETITSLKSARRKKARKCPTRTNHSTLSDTGGEVYEDDWGPARSQDPQNSFTRGRVVEAQGIYGCVMGESGGGGGGDKRTSFRDNPEKINGWGAICEFEESLSEKKEEANDVLCNDLQLSSGEYGFGNELV